MIAARARRMAMRDAPFAPPPIEIEDVDDRDVREMEAAAVSGAMALRYHTNPHVRSGR